MTKPTQSTRYPTPPSVYLAANFVQTLIWGLPSGTAFCIGVVLVTLMTGQLVQHKGSLARAALPYVAHLRWGWHRVERALERGKLSLDRLFDLAYAWCLEQLPVEPLCLGIEGREVWSVDSSTIARLRAGAKLGLAGKGYCHRCRRAVKANIVAVATRVVRVVGVQGLVRCGLVRCGLVRRARFGESCEQAIAVLWADLPLGSKKRLYVVDAGIASAARFTAATEQAAVLGRLRINTKLRCAPPPAPDKPKRGRPPQHGPVLHPGIVKRRGQPVDAPEVAPDEELVVAGAAGPVRLRRWKRLHFEETPQVELDVVRIDDPTYGQPLLVGSTARELTTLEFWHGYQQRWPVETDFFVAQDTAAMEKPRAWHEKAVERRITLALLVGCVLKAIAASCEALPMGPWDRRAAPTAGRLANYLDLHAWNFAAFALQGTPPRNYRKNQQPIEETLEGPSPHHVWPNFGCSNW